MPFEPLAHYLKLPVPGVPPNWLPLLNTFDPDLPLFPMLYFHVLANDLDGRRPAAEDRAYGYIRSAEIDIASRELIAEVVCNKNLTEESNARRFGVPVERAVKDRLGATDPVTLNDIQNVFPPGSQFADRTAILEELWHRVVDYAYGGLLPFGAFWDPVLGLARYFASWYPPTGRKSEIIMTHFFASRFGERISTANPIPSVDFFLHPTWEELTDPTNSLSLFPQFQNLVSGTIRMCANQDLGYRFFETFNLTNWSYTGFTMPSPRPDDLSARIDEGVFNYLLAPLPSNLRESLTECFNAFDKGAQRTIIFLMFLNDVRKINDEVPSGLLPRINPPALTPQDAADVLINLNYYQSPKVISIYSQQCHLNHYTLPIDTWVGSFLEWPLAAVEYNPNGRVIRKNRANLRRLATLITESNGLGKVERLIWVTAQARKVHSSACDDAVWCIKGPRGANPLACKVCATAMRDRCPAFSAVRNKTIVFNAACPPDGFAVATSGGDVSPGQSIVSCEGYSTFAKVEDNETPIDSPGRFQTFPVHGHNGSDPMLVSEFVDRYCGEP